MRPENWLTQFAEYIEGARFKLFEWGQHDCASFVAGWLTIANDQLDVSPLTPERADATEGARLMHEQSLADRVMTMGLEEIAPIYAQRGDVLLIESGDRQLLAIHSGDYAIAPGPDQLEFQPNPHLALRAWRV